MLSHPPWCAWAPSSVHKIQVTPHHTRLRIHKANILRICDRSNLDLLQKEWKMKRWRRCHHRHKQQGIMLVRCCRVHKRQRKFIHIRYYNLYAWRSRNSNSSSIVSRLTAIVAPQQQQQHKSTDGRSRTLRILCTRGEEKWHALPSIVSCKMSKERKSYLRSGRSVPASQSLSQSVCVSLSYFHFIKIRRQQQSAYDFTNPKPLNIGRLLTMKNVCTQHDYMRSFIFFSFDNNHQIISWVCAVGACDKDERVCDPGCRAMIACWVVTVLDLCLVLFLA